MQVSESQVAPSHYLPFFQALSARLLDGDGRIGLALGAAVPLHVGVGSRPFSVGVGGGRVALFLDQGIQGGLVGAGGRVLPLRGVLVEGAASAGTGPGAAAVPVPEVDCSPAGSLGVWTGRAWDGQQA